MKKIMVVGLLLFALFLAVQYWWFRETMQCVINRASSGITVDWATIRDCSY